MTLEAGTLTGRLVRLEPLAPGHAADLAEAAGEDRGTFGFAGVPTPDAVDAHIAELLSARDAGACVPFAQVRLADGRAIGGTRFLTFRRPGADVPFAVEIGGTWLATSAQRSGINVEAKLLLLEHAFSVWRVGRVDIKTDERNERARAAIAALGATFEGVLRHWQPSQAPGEGDRLRDTAMYAVTDDDWPAVREHLRRRLARYAGT